MTDSSAQAVHYLLDHRDEFASVFQPILSLQENRFLGYEALLRLPPGSMFSGPEDAFDAAADTEFLVDLEYAALEAHLRAAAALPQGRLFVNLSASAFLDARMGADTLAARVRSAGFTPSRVVLEITELVRVHNAALFAEALRPLQREGFQLAVDDFGAGFSNVSLLVELGPDFLKIDRSLVAGASRHPRKRVFLECISMLGRRINCCVIAEGVETPEDLATVRACGIEHAQGWGIVRPAPIEFFLEGSHLPEVMHGVPLTIEEPVGSFSLPRPGIEPATPVGHVIELFEASSELESVPIVEGSQALGLVTRNMLFFHLGHRYGFSVWHDRPISAFVTHASEGCDRIPASSTADQGVELVRRRPASRRFEPLIVETERGDYHGLLPVDLLLAEITRLKVEYALQSNPLTGLPGSVALARAAECRLTAGQLFTLGWADIDAFKPFNDHYGFSRGDDVIRLLAEVLRENLAGEPTAFLAHLGGDDFAFLVAPASAETRAERAAHEFTARARDLYDATDRAAGIESVDRLGTLRRFGLISLSIGLVRWSGEPGVEFRHLAEIAAEVKSHAKRTPGAAVATNARALTNSLVSQPSGRPIKG